MPEHLERNPRPVRHLRRGIGLLVGGSPLLLVAASLTRAAMHGDEHRTVGLIVMLAALAVGGLNFYLSLLRGFIYSRVKGSLDGYKRVSGIPLVGSVLVVVGTVTGFGSVLCGGLGLLAVVLDTGGSVWFVIATWRDSSMWDA